MTWPPTNVGVIDAARRLLDQGVMDDDENDWQRHSASLDEAIERLHVAVLRAHRVSCGCPICFPRAES